MWLKKRQLIYYASDISYQASIGKNIKFPHPTGIVIGIDAVVEDNVMIWQNTTLGSIGKANKSYPTVNSGVKIFCNSQILGEITLGEGSIIGASSLVLKDVPKGKTAVGIPAKIID